jgi:hypothetical protein
MARDEPSARGARSIRGSVRSAGHAASGGHSLHRNHISREPNVLPPQHKAHHTVAHHEYPKRLYIDGKSVRVFSAEEEAAALAPAPVEPAEEAPKRRGRPPKAEAEPAAEAETPADEPAE